MRRKKITFEDLPNPGDAFVFPLKNGLYGVCRVIRKSTKEEMKFYGAPHILIAASSWFGKNIPDEDDPSLRNILPLKNSNYNEELCLIWVDEQPGSEYKIFGTIVPSDDDLKLDCYKYGGWSLATQAEMQWQRNNEKQKELIDDQEFSITKEHIFPKSLNEFLEYAQFEHWQSSVSRVPLIRISNLLTKTVNEVFSFGKNRDLKGIEIIKNFIKDTNKLNAKYTFIGTNEREELFDILIALLELLGVQDPEKIIDEVRDW